MRPAGGPVAAPPGRRGRSAPHRDERGGASGFVLRSIVIFALLGLVLYEVGQVVMAQLHAEGVAQAAAQAGADAYFMSKDATQAKAAALDAASSKDPAARVLAFAVGPDGTVTVSAEETAHTLFLSRIAALRRLFVQRATEEASHLG